MSLNFGGQLKSSGNVQEFHAICIYPGDNTSCARVPLKSTCGGGDKKSAIVTEGVGVTGTQIATPPVWLNVSWSPFGVVRTTVPLPCAHCPPVPLPVNESGESVQLVLYVTIPKGSTLAVPELKLVSPVKPPSPLPSPRMSVSGTFNSLSGALATTDGSTLPLLCPVAIPPLCEITINAVANANSFTFIIGTP